MKMYSSATKGGLGALQVSYYSACVSHYSTFTVIKNTAEVR